MDVLDDRVVRRIFFCSFMLCFMKYLKAIKTNKTLVQLNNDFYVMPGYNQYKLAYQSRTEETTSLWATLHSSPEVIASAAN